MAVIAEAQGRRYDGGAKACSRRTPSGQWPVMVMLLVAAIAQSVDCARSALKPGSFVEGDEVGMECRNIITGQWEPGPICHETKSRFSVFVGVDTFRYCAFEVASQEVFESLRSIVSQNSTWHCRVPSSKLRHFHHRTNFSSSSSSSRTRTSTHRPDFIPFQISYIGESDGPDHLRINARINFVFHLFQGQIVAASAYPVLDRLQYVKLGSLASMHVSVVWFTHLGVKAGSSSGGLFSQPWSSGGGRSVAVISALSASLLTAIMCSLFYVLVARPAVIRRCLKSE